MNFERKRNSHGPSFQDKMDELRLNLHRLWKTRPAVVVGCVVGVLVVIAAAAAAVILLSGDSGKTFTQDPEDEENTEWVAPKEDETYDASAGVIDVEVFSGTVLPETEDAGWDYVAETLFLGDSNTYRYMMYGHEEVNEQTGKKEEVPFTSTANNIGVVSMGAGAITSLKCEEFKGDSKSYTMPEAVAKLKPRRIIIGFGTNNLSGASTKADSFIETYKKGIKAIEEAWPYADMIVNSIPPLDKQRENTNLSQIQIDAYNEAIVEMCEAEGWKYLNSAEVLKDAETGWAKKDYTLGDGVHLSKDAVTALFGYIRTHAYIAEDRRPQPLGDIPTPNGVIPNLINKDPIANRNPRYPIEVTVNGEGSASASASSAKGGTSVTLSASPAEGWKFSHWTCSAGSISGNTLSVPANCDANGVVVVAHFVEDIPEHEHRFTSAAANATCTSGGYTQYTCEECGYSYRENVTEALGHNMQDVSYGATCANEGFSGSKCSVCGYQEGSAVPRTGHNMQDVSYGATCTTDGFSGSRCTVCGYQEGSTVPAYGHSFNGGQYCANGCGTPDPSYVAPQPQPEPEPQPQPEPEPQPQPEPEPAADPEPANVEGA